MAPIANDPTATSVPTTAPYTSAILLATFALLVVILLLSPLCWHCRNRNIGATMLVAWAILINFQSFVNALIWSHDDLTKWYNGRGLCDIEVKIVIALGVAAPASLAAVLRALANAIDTNRVTLTKSKAQRIRDYAIDLTFCLGAPALQMLFHYIVQPRRYLLFGIFGCAAAQDRSWLTIVLLDVPPMIWTLVDSYYATLILVRLCRYRATMGSILASSNMSKNRFLRLYIFCTVFIVAFVPLQAFTLRNNLIQGHGAFHWHEVHNSATWNQIIMLPSQGEIMYQSFIWLGSGVFIFVFFGMGRDASTMYKDWLRSIGFAKVFPSLQPGSTPRHSVAGTISSLGSKTKLMFKRKSWASWQTDSCALKTTSTCEAASPKAVTFMDTIDEEEATSGQAPAFGTKAMRGDGRPSLLSRMATAFTRRAPATQDTTLVASGQRSSTYTDSISGTSLEVIVRKEVRQGSETAETIPATSYNAA